LSRARSLLVGIVLYLGIGMGYMYKFKGARGKEMLPNQEFWKSLPGLIKARHACRCAGNHAVCVDDDFACVARVRCQLWQLLP